MRTVQSIEKTTPKQETRAINRKISRHFTHKIGLVPISLLLVALLIASTAIAFYQQGTNHPKDKQTQLIPNVYIENQSFHKTCSKLNSMKPRLVKAKNAKKQATKIDWDLPLFFGGEISNRFFW